MLNRMMKRYADLRKKEDGFTLIELLIVIVILGVLAGVVVFAVSGITDRGNMAACKADKKTVEVAIEAYYAQSGSYPANMAALVPAFLHSTPSSTADFTVSPPVVTGKAGTTTC